MKKIGAIFVCFLNISFCVYLQSATVEIDVSKRKAEINPIMWGIFFEDINFGADGGLSAELVKNRGFEFPESLMGWKVIKDSSSEIKILQDTPFNFKNPNYVRIINSKISEPAGIVNEGFRGIGVKKNEQYLFSAWARLSSKSNGYIEVSLYSADNNVIASTRIKNLATKWQKIECLLKPSRTEKKAYLKIMFYGIGNLDLDMVSLYPKATWKNRQNGLRADLVQMLADLKPGFMRFPGGCIVEGRTLETRYQWKNTIGKPEERKLIINRWNTEFKHRPAPDYYQSFALGFYEFFLLCEDIGAEPLPILNCGMACQFNSGELAPIEQLNMYIQDALDLIEFANGNKETGWGRIRAELGHPKPFNLKMIGVGNEQWGARYIERYKRFAEILKKKHPEITLISSAGPDPDGEKFEYLWGELRALKADIIDEHYYRKPDWFINNINRYDNYDRNGPKVFAGEYAAQSIGVAKPDNKNTLECALSEAVFMTGLEKNADVVRLCSYAPLFAHTEAWQWTPDLIWLDNLSVYGTPSYYVQKMFSNNRGDIVVSLNSNSQKIFATAAIDKKENKLILKIINPYGNSEKCTFKIAGVNVPKQQVKGVILNGKSADECNSIETPHNVIPKEFNLAIENGNFLFDMPQWSFVVMRIIIK